MQKSLETPSPDIHIARERIAAESIERTGILNLRDLRLTVLPEELSGLKHLEILHCSHTQVSDLSPLTGFDSLRELHFAGTQVDDLSSLAGLGSLQELDCSQTRVGDLSPLAGLDLLQKLYCGGTQVDDLLPLAGLTSLQQLNCSGTQVHDLSPLAGLGSLQLLFCSFTQRVGDLSPLAGLGSLQTLFCSSTQVDDLAPLRKLSLLRNLDCSETRMGDLSPLAGLGSLQWLFCSGTQADDLSPLTELGLLQELEFSHCSLNPIPGGLFRLSTLRSLYLYQTRISGVPAEVLSQTQYDNCLDSLRAYLRALESGSVESTDVKLLILGNGRIGKTQICRRLRKEKYDVRIASTHGIIVSSASLQQSEDVSPMLFHLWDFGGQDIYHGTHALFMRTRAIFMLVWIPEAEVESEYEHCGLIFRNQPLDYWLSYIRHLSGLDNPVLVVQTRCDRPDDEIRHLPVANHALDGFRFCKLLQYSSLKNRGRAALGEALHEAASWLREEQGSILIGNGWMRVKLRLEAMRDADAALPPEQTRNHRTLSQEYFRELCAEGEGDVDSPEYLLQYLHNCGTVFYRQGLFQERIILDQSWALEAIYTVFHREKCYKHLRYSRGRFYRSLLEDLAWQAYSEEEQKLFLYMMLSCGICFLHQQGDEERGIEPVYIAPDLLPDKAEVTMELEERWDSHTPTEEALFEYELHQPGLLRSFVSRIGNEAGLNALYWKGGMFLYEHTCRSRALIEQESRGGMRGLIRLQTQNGDARSLLSQLTERLMKEQERWGIRHLISTCTLPPQSKLDAPQILPEPSLPKLKFTWEPDSTVDYCISYAWGDETEEGKRREDIVDRLCTEAEARGIRILRDKSVLGVGDNIPAFMQNVAQGKRVFVVLSHAYLRSSNCMFELWEIWRNSRLEKDEFLRRTRIYALPDVRIFGMDAHIEHTRYWNEKLTRYTSEVQLLSAPQLAEYARIKQYVHNLGAILSAIESTVLPRNFDELVKYGLDDLKQSPAEAH
jgi:internalin A